MSSRLCVHTVIRDQIKQLSLNCLHSQVAEANTDDACMQITIASMSASLGESAVHLSKKALCISSLGAIVL